MALDSDGNGIRDNADAFCNDPNWMTDSNNKDKDVSVMRKMLSPFDQLETKIWMAMALGTMQTSFLKMQRKPNDSGDGVGDNAYAFPNNLSFAANLWPAIKTVLFSSLLQLQQFSCFSLFW